MHTTILNENSILDVLNTVKPFTLSISNLPQDIHLKTILMDMSMCAKLKATFQVEHPQMQPQLQLTLQSGQVKQLPSDKGLS